MFCHVPHLETFCETFHEVLLARDFAGLWRQSSEFAFLAEFLRCLNFVSCISYNIVITLFNIV